MTVCAVQELDFLLVQMPGFLVSMAYSILPSLDLSFFSYSRTDFSYTDGRGEG